jgi:hypothetical protein
MIRESFKVHTYAAGKLARAIPEPMAPIFEVVTIRPHPDLWAMALADAGGDASRIEIVTPTHLVVHRAGWDAR